MLSVLLLITAGISPACRVEDALYSQRSEPSITARFHDVARNFDWPSGLALEIRFAESGRRYWWLPWDGGSNGEQSLASTSDVTAPGWHTPSSDDGRERPLGDVQFIATDAHYTLLSGVPRKGGPAPSHFLIPNLRDALWYRTPPDKRDGDARQFFDLVGCNAMDGRDAAPQPRHSSASRP